MGSHYMGLLFLISQGHMQFTQQALDHQAKGTTQGICGLMPEMHGMVSSRTLMNLSQ